ncbi:Barrel-sandwich domain of CusB or HlyD membrane-fusion [Geosporobacter subterraneus DSM 17957]|uniref:Barrel-sandwich domain of CusB or HlyD membrane-fusion n=1 Tax=Geosporobacter subterraneus DSM 17957 TaxID=1121919 RepID=A0A1M6MHW0_9FIRM|nr:efflux RND transporter periplasmic adaptor subunit [Geosporobacter subterraneus]SHJ82873.1 Barrel-sandwich domain of CusB or HlyD membrane-fusion [Geosporobacter subterraneus DSM 17957]
MKRRIRNFLLIVLILPMLFASGCNKAKNKPIEEEPVVEEKTTVEAFGYVRAENYKNVVIDIPGRIERIQVKEGQQVAKGDILVILDTRDFDAQIRKKEQELRILELEKQKVEKTIFEDLNKDPEIKKLMGDLQFAEDELGKAQKDFQAKEVLYKQGAISQQEYDGELRNTEGKRKAVEDARLAIEAMKNEKRLAKDQLLIQSEKIEVGKSELTALREKLKRQDFLGNQIVSEIEKGVVYEIGYSQGDILSPEKKLCSILDLNSLVVKAEVAEEFVKDVKLGAPAAIIPLADKSKEYEGKVVGIAGKAVQKGGETLVIVDIAIENNDGFLMPDFNVDVSIDIK